MSVDFVVIDFETTGLLPKSDRVIEIGAVRTSASGKTLAKFSSLIKPGRDVGPTQIHGITPRMLENAPSFGEVLKELSNILSGAVLVAHNASFDVRFLDAELERLNHDRADIDALCTMELMSICYPKTVRRLVDCCSYLNLPILNAHTALDDAQMTSNLFHLLIKNFDELEIPEPLEISSTSNRQQPLLSRNSVAVDERSVPDYVASLLTGQRIDRALISSETNECQYLNILDDALSDRVLTVGETSDLSEFASLVRMSKVQVRALHYLYVKHLFSIAMDDGVYSPAERSDLDHVAKLLNVEDWENVVDPDSLNNSIQIFEKYEIELSEGTSVCFTGTMIQSRDVLEGLARSNGLLVKQGISKILDVLVVADAGSMSGKAKKAREIGIQIITEQVFLSLLETKN